MYFYVPDIKEVPANLHPMTLEYQLYLYII